MIRNIEVAARTGGPDPDGNPTLYDAIYKAKKSSVPGDNIDRAVKRGSGALGDAVDYQNILYEGYGPGGVAILIECLTDNKNRAAAEVRLAFTKGGGNLADPGSVSYQFSRKGFIVLASEASEDSVLEATIEHNIEDIEQGADSLVLTCEASSLVHVRQALQDAGLDYESADVEFVSSIKVEANADTAGKIVRLVESLEDLDDVQEVYTNMDVSNEVLSQLAD